MEEKKEIEQKKKRFFAYHKKEFDKIFHDLLEWGGFKLNYTKKEGKKLSKLREQE